MLELKYKKILIYIASLAFFLVDRVLVMQFIVDFCSFFG